MLTSIHRVRVEWGNCDSAGIIFNPHYYIWMDQGCHRLLEAAGFDFPTQVRSTDFKGCPLVGSSAEFFSPARFGDILAIHSRVKRFGRKSFVVEHQFICGETEVAKGQEIRVWGWVHPQDKNSIIGVPVPEDVKEALSQDGSVEMDF